MSDGLTWVMLILALILMIHGLAMMAESEGKQMLREHQRRREQYDRDLADLQARLDCRQAHPAADYQEDA